ncbi:TIM-barrel domain-containing protein [Bacteroides sp. UBA939]|uniref:TIM-barrel domain-containing protein n=1 Tax=Bacteroides sp. UBA939 TaxID=1946092 RepID=UPI0025C42E1C|nr:TIM-barrel domain-containing protein [Bacteroides sp. UBA939]
MSNLLSNLNLGKWKVTSLAFFLLTASSCPAAQAAYGGQINTVEQQQVPQIAGVTRINPTTVEVLFSNQQRMTIDFYGENIFRMFQDNAGGILRDPAAKPEAKILVSQPRKGVSLLDVKDEAGMISIATAKVKVQLDKNTALMKVVNLETGVTVLEETQLTLFEKERVTLRLKENPQEYFYGGGVQNGRFSHKGKTIAIENQNSWTDGGVASPNPYYWSTNGYGIMWYTFKRGVYDFGRAEKGIVKLSHETDYLDLFVMVNDGAVPLLNDYYQLTGNPVLIPKFGFYQGHLNAYNRDYWKEDESGILFEDGKRYKESQKDNGGTKESLNGEKNNYQFSARAVIDRYKNHDMPFGWLLPNDGYGAGYGQTETIDGNIRNLKELTDYAHRNGVEIGLWTQSDLHPKAGISALLQRDIVKEVRDAGVRVLKTDVAWVGAGYSFGLNGITDVANIMTYYGNDARPFIISLDGWAGTQRYAGIWSGDQTGGTWEYIRFHIPTYIGSGLSGNPNICSDMDGIFGGKNPVVNTRDFQWKTFTPMQLNMDGWGSNEKYPHALGEPATSINRWYLKLKSEIMPYAYSIARESVDGLPMIRAMLLEYPNPYTSGKATQYQFLYGPYFLVAPIYQATKDDEQGNDIRNGIYLPEGEWVDYFSGEIYQGNRIINSYASPLWKLPIFVKNGAIIPMTSPNNNVKETAKNLRIYELYPYGQSTFTEYDDDGITEEYRTGKGVTTLIESGAGAKGDVTVTIQPAQGDFNGFVKEKATEFRINVTEKPKKVSATIGKSKVKLAEASSMEEFLQKENVYFYDAKPNLNKFATKGSEFEKEIITKNPQFLVKLAATDITANRTTLKIDGFVFAPTDSYKTTTGSLVAPKAQVTDENTASYTLKPTWSTVDNADYYEIEFNGMNYSTIKDTELIFDDLNVETAYDFKIRAVNKDGYSDWSTFSATTKKDPLEFAIHGITGETSVQNQGRSLRRLFDFEEGELWHTKYNEKAVPFDLVIDLKTINQIEKFHYLPRGEAGNGTILKGTVSYSMDKENWTEAGAFEWQRNSETKVFSFPQTPTVRYIKMNVTEAVGNYGSGKELYVFKVPGTESYLPGDINNDKLVDENDLTSYTNYTGLRRGDADFEGYISNGDLNRNGLIDAYDISAVATQLGGGAKGVRGEKPEGSLSISTSKRTYAKDEIIQVLVKGTGLRHVNALSFALPYNPADYEFVGVQQLGMKDMENLTNDRLHTNGVKSLYPTFVNIGEKESLEGDSDLFIIKLKARKNVTFNLKVTDGYLVDKHMNVVMF